MRAGVTGANGLVGSNLVKMLLNKGVQVKALVRSEKSKTELLSSLDHDYNNLKIVIGDILDKQSIAEFITGIDTLFHAAAYVSFNPYARKQIYHTNVIGTKNIVNALIDKQTPPIKLVYMSSVAALGNVNNGNLINEADFNKGNDTTSHYSKSKYLAELEVWRGIEEGLNATILNPTVILGNTIQGKSSSALLKQMQHGLPFVSSGSTGFVTVNDVCRAAIEVAQNPTSHSERFILCSANMSYQKLFTIIGQLSGQKRTPIVINKKIVLLLALLNETISLIFNITPKLTRQIVKSGYKQQNYDGSKIVKQLDFQYSDLQKELKEITSQT